MRERPNQDTAHLEQQEHPGDAEAEKGAPNKAGHPRQSQECKDKGRWESEGLEV